MVHGGVKERAQGKPNVIPHQQPHYCNCVRRHPRNFSEISPDDVTVGPEPGGPIQTRACTTPTTPCESSPIKTNLRAQRILLVATLS